MALFGGKKKTGLFESIVAPGQKVEYQSLHAAQGEAGESGQRRVYKGAVFDVLSEDSFEITMPTEGTKMILLPVGREYSMVFYVGKTLYQCDVQIYDRYKRDNIYILAMHVTSNLVKFQRRAYYRFSCSLAMNSRTLEEDEIRAFEEKENILLPELPLRQGVILDISGGGLRFIATQPYEKGSMIFCTYTLTGDNGSKDYSLMGEVLEVKEMPSKPGVFEHRVEFKNIRESDRDEIIRYIFDAERKLRQKEIGEQ